jgi:hypothetical protein
VCVRHAEKAHVHADICCWGSTAMYEEQRSREEEIFMNIRNANGT